MDTFRRLGIVVFGLLTIFGSYGQLAPASTTRQYEAGERYSYEYDTTVLINEVGISGKDVGYRITAQLGVSVVWQSPVDLPEKLLYFEVSSPKLHIKSRKSPSPEGFVGHTSKLDEMINGPFLIHWKDGIVSSIYLQEGEDVSLSNFKRGIASLFQIRPLDVKTEEIDASGRCSVSYDTDDFEIFKKHKTNCMIDKKWLMNNADNVTGVEISSTRDFRFSLLDSSAIVKHVTTNEVHDIKARLIQDVGGKVISKQEMRLTGISDNNLDLLKSDVMAMAVLELERAHQTTFIKSSLEIVDNNFSCQDDCPDLSKLVNENRKHLETENLGTSRSAGVFIKLLNVARQTKADQFLKVLKSQKNKRIIPQLIDLMGATQTVEAHKAAMKSFHFDSESDVDLVERYLWALSIGSNPLKDIIQDLVKRCVKNIANEKLSETLILTVAAMTGKLHPGPENKLVIDHVSTFILNELASCSIETCKQKYLRALKNLRSRDSIPAILEHALNGSRKTSVAAMKTLRNLPKDFWNESVMIAARKIFYQMERRYDSSSRTFAVDILLESGPSKCEMARLLGYVASVENRRGSATEVCHYALQRVKQLSQAPDPFGENFRNALYSAIKELNLNNYHALSHKGLSSALSWPFLESTSSNGSLVSILEISSGLLKQGAIDIVLENREETKPMFSLGLFAGGLGSFISSDESHGNDEEEEEEDEEYANAGMELTVMGVQLRPFLFFSGQGELMGHVWSGTASESTPAFQIISLLQDYSQTISLQSGLMTSIRILGAVSFDLSGQVQLSIWNKNAQSVVEKNAGVAFQGFVKVDSSFIKSQVETSLSTEAQLILISNLDFYSNVLLCLQLKQPDLVIRQNIHKVERIIGSKHRLRKSTYKVNTIPGKTYALNRKNNENCNMIFSTG